MLEPVLSLTKEPTVREMEMVENFPFVLRLTKHSEFFQ